MQNFEDVLSCLCSTLFDEESNSLLNLSFEEEPIPQSHWDTLSSSKTDSTVKEKELFLQQPQLETLEQISSISTSFDSESTQSPLKNADRKKKIYKIKDKKSIKNEIKFFNFNKKFEKKYMQKFYKIMYQFGQQEYEEKKKIIDEFVKTLYDRKKYMNYKNQEEETLENFMMQILFFSVGCLKGEKKERLDSQDRQILQDFVQQKYENQTLKSTSIAKIYNYLVSIQKQDSFVCDFDELKCTNMFSDLLMINKEKMKIQKGYYSRQQLKKCENKRPHHSRIFQVNDNYRQLFNKQKDISSFMFKKSCRNNEKQKSIHRIPIIDYLQKSKEANISCEVLLENYRLNFQQQKQVLLNTKIAEEFNYPDFFGFVNEFMYMIIQIAAIKAVQKGLKRKKSII